MNTMQQRKFNLGKLLASENLRIEHRNVQTASFDVKNRVLVLPNWKEMNENVYDLFIGHEVGHALYTPTDGWIEGIAEEGMNFKSFLNIVEDVRIERKMKSLYPGLRKPMYEGYSDLMHKGFFGVDYDLMNYLPFADRVNLYFKLGSRSNINFTESEKTLVDKIAEADEWDEVYNLALELKKITEREKDTLSSLFDDIEFDDFSEEGGGGFSDSSISSKTIKDLIERLREEGKEEEAERLEEMLNNASDETMQQLKEWSQDESSSSITDEYFEKYQHSLIDNSSDTEINYCIFPNIDSTNYVVPSNIVRHQLNYDSPLSSKKEEIYNEFMSANRKYISYMVKEFELHKNAKQFSRAKTAKTGKLDIDRLWSYKTSDNLFLQNTIVPNGKSHGMIMLMDMSASMTDNIEGTIEQLLVMAIFCRKINVPFEVYGFYDNYGYTSDFPNECREVFAARKNEMGNAKNNEIVLNSHQFRLKELINSSMNSKVFKEVVTNLLIFGKIAGSWGSYARHDIPANISLGGTPLQEAIIVLADVAKKFRERTNVEILNTIVLTDGDATGTLNKIVERNDGNRQLHYLWGKVCIQDTETGSSITSYSRSLTNSLLEIYRKRTGSRVIGFYLMSNPSKTKINAFTRKISDFNLSFNDFEKKYDGEYKKNKFFSVGSLPSYDSYYILSGNEMKIENQEFDDVLSGYKNKDSKGSIMRAFRKIQNKKNNSRVLANRFVEQIS